jgi:hypothetical protein
VRFLGRHVFVGALVLLVMGSASCPTPPTPPPARQTRRRWRSFWQERLMASALFIEMVACRMSSALDPAEMPDALLDSFAGDLTDRVSAVLRLLAPWTTLSVPPESARSAMVP